MQLAALSFYACLELLAVTAGVAAMTVAGADEPASMANLELSSTEPLRVTQDRVYVTPPPIVVRAIAVESTLGPDDPLPIRFTLVNTTNAPLNVLRSLDGSGYGMRYPKIDIEIRDAEGRLVEAESPARCGNTNTLLAEDFIEIAPGDEGIIFGEGSFGHWRDYQHGLAAGTYTVVLRYDLSAPESDADLFAPSLMGRVIQLPHGVFTSSPVTITVTN